MDITGENTENMQGMHNTQGGTEEQDGGDGQFVLPQEYTDFFGAFFGGLMESKEADVIRAREFLFQSIDPSEAEASSAEEFLGRILYCFRGGIKPEGYYARYLAHGARIKTGLFSWTYYSVLECLVTCLERVQIPERNGDERQRVLRAAFAYLNSTYEKEN